MSRTKIDYGIYDNIKTNRTLKIVDIGIDDFGYKIVTLYFTNDPIFGKTYFSIPYNNLKNFLKGYKKRKN
jgi:hypothetical protein